jgi:inner membrane protein
MNAAEHRLVSALTLGLLGTVGCYESQDTIPRAAAFGLGGYCCATLPDLFEPATSPHHRQFFHGVVFAVGLGYGLYKLYEFEPQSTLGEVARLAGLIAGGAYLLHLALDATTKRSLPLVGRL